MLNPRSRQPAHRVTTANLGAAYPFMAEGGLGIQSAYIGRDWYGGSFFYDPWALYPHVITGPNMVVVGQLGKGKSSLVKTYVWRQLVFGRKVVMLDPKGENRRLCQAAGVDPIRIDRQGAVRLNPLDRRIAGANQDRELILLDQLDVLYAVIGAALGRELKPEEQAAAQVALIQASRLRDEPTLPDVAVAMLAPGREAAEELSTRPWRLAEGSREAALALRRVCEGDLRGMFDAATTVTVDFEAPIVSLDMSAVRHSPALGMLMVCAAAWFQRALMRESRVRRIVVIDEAWAILSNLAIARWLQQSSKLARAYGVQNIAVVHRLSDLDTAGGEQAKIARGLLSDSETQVIYAQSSAEAARTQRLLDLSDEETELSLQLVPHVALWRIGQRRFLVEHRLSRLERWIVDTDDRMVA